MHRSFSASEFDATGMLASTGSGSLRLSDTLPRDAQGAAGAAGKPRKRRGSGRGLEPMRELRAPHGAPIDPTPLTRLAGTAARPRPSDSRVRAMFEPANPITELNRPVPVPTSMPETMKSESSAFDGPTPVPRSRMDLSFGPAKPPPDTLPSALGNTGASSPSGGGAGGGGAQPYRRKPPRADAPAGEGVVAGSTYAIQSHGDMWHYVGRVEPIHERPARRKDILDLIASYEDAMAHAERAAAAAMHGTEAGGRSDPVLDQDFMNLRGMAEDMIVENAPPMPGSDDTGGLTGAMSRHRAFQRGSEVMWRLAVILFHQKWTDLVTADAEAQVGVTFLEQGKLIGRLRAGHAKVFGEARDLIKILLAELSDTARRLDEREVELAEARQEIKNTEERMEGRYQARLNEVAAGIASERDAARSEAKDARDNADRMSETLRTLNGIFKQLRDDTDAMRDADLREVAGRLETRLQERERELNGMIHLKREAEELRGERDRSAKEAEALRKELEKTKAELADRSALCQQVMQRENERLVELELMAQSVAMAGVGAEDGPSAARKASSASVLSALKKRDTAEPSEKSGEEVDAYEAMFGKDERRGRSKPPESMLCIRCQARLDDLADLEESDDEETKRQKAMLGKHPPAMYYRVMLPVLQPGIRPLRPAAWVRWVMRAILLTKFQADAIAVREGRARPRLPELAHSWFAPTVVQVAVDAPEEPDATVPPGSAAPPGAVTAATTTVGAGRKAPAEMDGLVTLAEADECRWALYYGVRDLARESPEAKLFHNFLSEKYGEDEITFYLHCLRTVQESLEKPLQWGPTTFSCGFQHVPPRLMEGPLVGYDDQYPAPSSPASRRSKRGGSSRPSSHGASREALHASAPFVPDVVWVPLSDAVRIAEQLMERASDEDRKTVLWRIKAKAQPSAGRLYGTPAAAIAEGSAHAELDGLGGEEPVVEELQAAGKGKEVGAGDYDAMCVDLSLMMRMMLIEYREEQAHRKAALRLMFETAQQAVEEQQKAVEEQRARDQGIDPATISKRNPFSKKKVKELNIGFGAGAFKGTSVDFKQFKAMIKTMNAFCSPLEVAALYRDSYEAGRGGVTVDSFLLAAQRRQFFSSCLRLPSFMGVSRRNVLTPYQQSQLSFVVDKHYRTLSLDLLPWLSGHLVEDHIVRLNQLLADLRSELNDDAAGLRRDGRRPLVAYRRLTDFLMWIRMLNREIRGEDEGSKAVIKVETELTTMEAVLRVDAGALGPPEDEMKRIAEVWRGEEMSDAQWEAALMGNVGDYDEATSRRDFSASGASAMSPMHATSPSGGAGGEDESAAGGRPAGSGKLGLMLFRKRDNAGKNETAFEVLHRVNLLVNTIKIQRVFRERQRVDDGVPWSMRKLMRVGYNPRTGSHGADKLLARPSSAGTKPKSLAWLLHNIAQILLEKVHADVADERESQPKQSLITFLYDQALTKCGVRDLAERALHELFVAVRAHMGEHPRVRAFALFCGIRITHGTENPEDLKMLEMTDALEYYLVLLRRIQSKQKRKGKRRLSVNFLFNPIDDDAPHDVAEVTPVLVDSQPTLKVVEDAMRSLSDAALAGVRRISAIIDDGLINLDEALMICMEEWGHERRRRQEELDSLFRVGDVNLDNVLSLDEFIPIIKHAAPTKSDKDIVRMFREASTLTDQRRRRRAARAAASAAAAVTKDGVEAALNQAGKEVDLPSFMEISNKYGLLSIKTDKAPPVPPGSDKEAQLMLLQEEWKLSADRIQEVTSKARMGGPVPVKRLNERLAILQRSFVECDKKLTLKAVQQGWLAYRLLMSEWNHYLMAVDEHERKTAAAAAAIEEETREGVESLDFRQRREMEAVVKSDASGETKVAEEVLERKRLESEARQKALDEADRRRAKERAEKAAT